MRVVKLQDEPSVAPVAAIIHAECVKAFGNIYVYIYVHSIEQAGEVLKVLILSLRGK